MKLHQPVLFVGLGGTGCLVGAELERRLRDEICGPDGEGLIEARQQDASLLRFQLPSCLQFVYGDVNLAELDRLPARSVPGEEYVSAVAPTASYVRELVPAQNTYQDLAANLRMVAEDFVESWLPPKTGEPRVAPLSRGAGQLPTVGRAALFETLRHGNRAVTRDLETAVGRLSKSGEDLRALGGSLPQSVDVFVAFSVAGGTGAGIFYDYIHLIGETLRKSNLRTKIYPLVVMPSAFTSSQGGGRPAQLNAGRALLDLFRLVDQQNAGAAKEDLRAYDPKRAFQAIDPDSPAVQYPGRQPIELEPAIMQTAFLFSLPGGADRSDLHRSVVELVMSLIGTELSGSNDDGQHQSFADSFINQGVEREIAAANGIGNRGVSTAQVASLTMPVDELADLVAGRLLRGAIEDFRSPLGGLPEENRAAIEDFITRAGIQPVLTRAQTPFAEPEPVTGAQNIAVALRERGDNMRFALRELDDQLRQQVPQLADKFDPRTAALGLLGLLDPFRLQRVLFGHSLLPLEHERQGARGLLQRLRKSPPAPQGFGPLPPNVPQMRDRFGILRVQWADEEPTATRESQDEWYRWRTRDAWAQAWDGQAPVWTKPMTALETRLRRLTEALEQHTREDPDHFADKAADLARARVGVSYLLPLRGGDMEQFYERVVNGMTQQRIDSAALRPAATPTELVRLLVDGERWTRAFLTAVDGQPPRAVAAVRDHLKEEVKRFLQAPASEGVPMLPSMAARLAQAAAVADNLADEADVQEFIGKLAGLVPAGFAPQGTGKLKILITYPAGAPNSRIEDFLGKSLNLPVGPRVQIEWKPVNTESLSVVMFRYGMGVTEVEEVRDVMRVWSQSLSSEEPEDFLKWRQRTGYDFGYLATREEHRVAILHRILCAVWNGRVRVTGDVASPDEVAIVLGGGVSMHLPLYGMGKASSWANIVQAYELGALGDDGELRRNFCLTLMKEVPRDLGRGGSAPDPLYLEISAIAEEQIRILDDMLERVPAAGKPRVEQFRRFWSSTLPAARQLNFGQADSVTANLEALEAGHAGRAQ